MTEQHRASRRDFVKKALYVAPAILTLQAAPAFAKDGSRQQGPGKEFDKPPIQRRILPRRWWWWRWW
jgi:hypothetical protein